MTARAFAFFVDACLALMVTGLLMSPLVYLADFSVLQNHNPAYLIWALVMVFGSLMAHGVTVGKRWSNLHLEGQGCLVCREIRRLAPFLVFGILTVSKGFLPHEIAKAAPFVFLGFSLFVYALPVLRGDPDFSHNSATGFNVTERA